MERGKYFDNYVEEVYNKIPPKSKVLDVGCNTGKLGKELKKRKDCVVLGIDLFEESLEIAKTRLDNVKKIDLEKYEKPFQDKFDVIVFADVLEHLRYPEKTLKIYKGMLNEEGFIIASIPNIANIKIRFSLLLGKWNYQESGILDKSHLRFFTKKTMKDLFQSSGYKIKIVDYTSGFSFLVFRYFKPLKRIRKILCGIWPSLFAFQFIVRGKKK